VLAQPVGQLRGDTGRPDHDRRRLAQLARDRQQLEARLADLAVQVVDEDQDLSHRNSPFSFSLLR
jgi:hypothetical protein